MIGIAMRFVTKTAEVDKLKCCGCETCIRLCPVVAIAFDKSAGRKIAKIDTEECQACGICVNRCPEQAISETKSDN